jgi:hypothetical protein
MHVVKVALLIVLTLAAMRLMSWSCLWMLGCLPRSDSLYARLASNVLAFCGFAGFLVVDRMPGELLDIQALIFGVVVFTTFFVVDTRWLPRSLAARIQRRRASPPAP